MVFIERLGLSEGEATAFKVVFRGNKIQFRLLWHKMVLEQAALPPYRSREHLSPKEVKAREKAFEKVRIEFTNDW